MVGVRRYTMLIKGKELDSNQSLPRGVLLRSSGIIKTYERDIMAQYIRQDDLGNQLSIPRLCKIILKLPGTVDSRRLLYSN